MTPPRLLTRLAFTVALLSCQSGDPAGPANGGIRVLFMGNSLTYTNDLPAMVRALAAASGESIETAMVAYPGFALEDHWNTRETRELVTRGDYDVVIMQQGPSSLPESRVFLREWTETWAPEIRSAGGEPGLFAVWPERAREIVFPDVSESYRLAALDVDGRFFPVGDTWLETWRLMPGAPLYGPDEFHPSVSGSYAAAVVIVAMLTNRNATSLAADFPMPASVGGSVESTVAARIREAAQTVIARVGVQTPR